MNRHRIAGLVLGTLFIVAAPFAYLVLMIATPNTFPVRPLFWYGPPIFMLISGVLLVLGRREFVPPLLCCLALSISFVLLDLVYSHLFIIRWIRKGVPATKIVWHTVISIVQIVSNPFMIATFVLCGLYIYLKRYRDRICHSPLLTRQVAPFDAADAIGPTHDAGSGNYIIKTFSIVVLVLGIAQASLALYGLFHLDTLFLLMTAFKATSPDNSELSNLNIPSSLINFSFMFASVTIIGTAWMISGLGMIRFYEWARKLWLVVISTTLIFYTASEPNPTKLPTKLTDWIEMILMLVIFVLSWSYLRGRSVRAKFKSFKAKMT